MAGDASFEGGSGTDNGSKGELVRERTGAKEWVLCGVEFDEEEEGDGVVRVREGVRRRGMGFRKETFFILASGDAW